MGQQQLLLVILVTIIVGIATVVAINTFSSAADSANLDAVRQDVATIAASAQGYYMKPDMLGGGGQDFTNITFGNIAFAADSINASGNSLIAINANAKYEITARSNGSFEITAHPASDDDIDLAADGFSATASNVLVADVLPDDLQWSDSN